LLGKRPSKINELNTHMHVVSMLPGSLLLYVLRQLTEQVRLFARCLVVVAHHGAAPAGNGVFMRDEALLVEINAACVNGVENPAVFADAGNGDFFKNAGKQYLGARIAFGYNKRRRDLGRHACKDYMYKGGVEVGVDEKRWKEVLKAAESMLIWGKPPPSVFFNSSRQLREEADAARAR
jgi:hypothetical protein